MRKSKTLTVNQQAAIAQFAVDHPEMTDRMIAQEMGCTVAQVRYARDKAESGELPVRRSHVSEYARAAGETLRADPDELLESQLHLVLGQLSADHKMKAAQRTMILAQLTRMKAKLFEMHLAKHMNATDAGVIYTLVRMFRPEATDKECIELYYEARETWRSER